MSKKGGNFLYGSMCCCVGDTLNFQFSVISELCFLQNQCREFSTWLAFVGVNASGMKGRHGKTGRNVRKWQPWKEPVHDQLTGLSLCLIVVIWIPAGCCRIGLREEKWSWLGAQPVARPLWTLLWRTLQWIIYHEIMNQWWCYREETNYRQKIPPKGIS